MDSRDFGLIVGPIEHRITLTTKRVRRKSALWDDTGESRDRHHIVKVIHTESGRFINFDYWTSIAEPEITKYSHAIQAYNDFVSDALSVQDKCFSEFCEEFSYEIFDEPKQVYEYCNELLNDIEYLYAGEIDLNDHLHDVIKLMDDFPDDDFPDVEFIERGDPRFIDNGYEPMLLQIASIL